MIEAGKLDRTVIFETETVTASGAVLKSWSPCRLEDRGGGAMTATSLRDVKPALTPDAGALTKAPSAPSYLSAHAKTEWKKLMPQLIARRILTRADLSGVESYCAAIGAVRSIADQLAGNPATALKLAGLQIRYMQTARQIASEYGLTPTTRARVGAAAPDGPDDDDPHRVAGALEPVAFACSA